MNIVSARLCCLGAVVAASMAASPASAASVDFIHQFHKKANGTFPSGGLVKLGNAFYGVLSSSGVKNGGGVFRITPNGHETTIYLFDKNGYLPLGGLVAVGGLLYGTTSSGGKYNGGTVFSITPEGALLTIYNFNPPTDGHLSETPLLAIGNVLYGLTYEGGPNDAGTAFSITTAGAFSNLHNFGGPGDAAFPGGPELFGGGALIAYQGLLYGVSSRGGTSNSGTVFTLTLAGAETVLHSFDSTYITGPVALTLDKGLLYGTTPGGGSASRGTIFSITPSGTLTTLYSAPNQPDTTGYDFSSNLVPLNGVFYGTTEYGGNGAQSCKPVGCGTIFSVTPDGTYTQVYVFPAIVDEDFPINPLIASGGLIYGAFSDGLSSIYAFTP